MGHHRTSHVLCVTRRWQPVAAQRRNGFGATKAATNPLQGQPTTPPPLYAIILAHVPRHRVSAVLDLGHIATSANKLVPSLSNAPLPLSYSPQLDVTHPSPDAFFHAHEASGLPQTTEAVTDGRLSPASALPEPLQNHPALSSVGFDARIVQCGQVCALQPPDIATNPRGHCATAVRSGLLRLTDTKRVPRSTSVQLRRKHSRTSCGCFSPAHFDTSPAVPSPSLTRQTTPPHPLGTRRRRCGAPPLDRTASCSHSTALSANGSRWRRRDTLAHCTFESLRVPALGISSG
jgi:hypothetical protein